MIGKQAVYEHGREAIRAGHKVFGGLEGGCLLDRATALLLGDLSYEAGEGGSSHAFVQKAEKRCDFVERDGLHGCLQTLWCCLIGDSRILQTICDESLLVVLLY